MNDEDEGPAWVASYWRFHSRGTYEANDLREAWAFLWGGEARNELAPDAITSPAGVTRPFRYDEMSEDEFDPSWCG